MRKPAIEARQGHTKGIDDILEPLAKKALSNVKRGKTNIKKAAKDIPDPKYKKNPYNAKGGMTKDYKDYVLRNSKGDY
jgi:hypothetical protein